MDSVNSNAGSVAMKNKQTARSMRSCKTKFEKPKKLVENLTSRVASKKIGIGEGVILAHNEFVKEIASFFAFFKPENKEKNARPDQVFLFDCSRVVLTDGSDYYHASFVDGYNRNNQYILAQAPFSKDTQTDFFRLVQQQKPDAIVYLEKADSDEGKFMLPTKETKIAGVAVKAEEDKDSKDDNYQTINLSVGKQKLKVFVVHSWTSDKEVPTKTILDTHTKVRKAVTWENKGSLLVVCHDGATRAGPFVLLDIETERVKVKQRIKLTETVRQIRAQRSHCLDSLEMFQSCFKMIQLLAKEHSKDGSAV